MLIIASAQRLCLSANGGGTLVPRRITPRPRSAALQQPWVAPRVGSRRESSTVLGATVVTSGCIAGIGRRRLRAKTAAAAAASWPGQGAGGTVWRRPKEPDTDADRGRRELGVRLDALRLMQQMRLPPLPPSANLRALSAATGEFVEFQRKEMEGHCAPEQLEFLREFVAHRFSSSSAVGGLRMCQIGFNAGHSATALLDQAPTGSVLLSLDLGRHSYTQPLEKLVAKFAEERGQTHILLLGDSAEMMPRFKHIEFDLIFIDGNHSYEAVKLDFLLCLQMARPDTVVLLNHVFTDMLEGVGPTKVWLESVSQGEGAA
ncbi:unnamed protein product [Polarella glacialis]|uniref:Uncharacterized protein n=1 Tax=Polarella glacialis TaxID=89957 RepID=A0A813DLE9_POLGL|nr:unnamed protein product [Polarella glacialis]